jgi:hypothetical protein
LQAGAWRRLTVKRCGRGFVLSLANNEEYIKEKKRKKNLATNPSIFGTARRRAVAWVTIMPTWPMAVHNDNEVGSRRSLQPLGSKGSIQAPGGLLQG